VSDTSAEGIGDRLLTPEMRRCYRLLLDMNDEQRGQILCWFCRGCNRYVGPGDSCTCERDE